MSTIDLRIINRSSDMDHSQIVIFQKNVAPSFNGHTIAWRVISSFGNGAHYSFTVPLAMGISAADTGWNQTPTAIAQQGQTFRVIRAQDGLELALTHSGAEGIVQVQNALESGYISARAYRDGKLLATQNNVPQGETTAFHFDPAIWIGAGPDIQEGRALDDAIIGGGTEISLLGIARADIVMTGGGEGLPFTFTLENVR